MNLILPDLTLFSRQTTAWNLIGGLRNLKKNDNSKLMGGAFCLSYSMQANQILSPAVVGGI